MAVAELLEQLETLGVSIEVVGDKVRCVPGSLVPPDLADTLRQHKAEIMARLRQEPVEQRQDKSDDPMATLLSRLQAGVRWLTETHNKLYVMKNIGLRSPLENRFLDALALWDNLDKMVRELYHFEGCVLGPGQRCPEGSPVSCRYCAERNRPHWVGDGEP